MALLPRVLVAALTFAPVLPAQDPVELTVQPAAVTLVGVRDARQLVVTGKFADGSRRDLTRVATVKVASPGVVNVQEGLFLRPARDGSTTLTLAVGAKSLAVPVTVGGTATPTPVSFRREVVAALNVGGCNAGACHGTPSGKNGFKLSLRGFDPAADLAQLTREQFGRRADALHPEASLMLLKGLAKVPHEGGARLSTASYPTEMIRAWLAAGAKDDAPGLPAVTALEVMPGARVLTAPAKSQQLAVVATFADGSKRDVTRLTNLSSSEPLIAEVGPTGFVEFKRPGEVAILARYLETMVSVRLTYLEPRPGFAWTAPPEANFVDTLTFAKLKTMSIEPSPLCTDSDFVRRATLDAVGRLPTADETRAFLVDPAPDRRAKLVEKLLTLPEFADFWALKWADVLRVEPQDDAGQGQLRLPTLAAREAGRRRRRDRRHRPRTAHRQRQHLRQPAGQLLPRRERPARARREYGATVFGRADAVREVPQPPVREVDAGRLLRLGRRVRPRRSRPARGGRREEGRRRVRRGDPVAPRR